jgi:predicted aconitase with swiveling domain
VTRDAWDKPFIPATALFDARESQPVTGIKKSGNDGEVIRLEGRQISSGVGTGKALVLESDLSFLGGVDPSTGRIKDKGTGAFNRTVRNRVLVFPKGKGSTVGSYVIYGLQANGKAPAAIVNAQTETIVATGAILAKIPLVDQVDIDVIRTGDRVTVDGDRGEVIVQRPGGG